MVKVNGDGNKHFGKKYFDDINVNHCQEKVICERGEDKMWFLFNKRIKSQYFSNVVLFFSQRIC
jgi:hypothetical protein